MINLIKYELIKRSNLFIISIISAILLDVFITLRYGDYGMAIFLGVLSIVMFIMYCVDIIQMYSKDLNNYSGYMIFMTPNSGYKILSSKVITAVLEGIGMIIFYLLIVFLSIFIVNGGVLKGLFVFDNPFGINAGHIVLVLFIALILAIQFLLTIYTAITIRKSVLANLKFKGLISFIIFLVLNFVINKIYELFNIQFMSSGPKDLGFHMNINANIVTEFALKIPNAGDLLINLLPYIILISVISVILTFISGYLLENKINL